MPAPTPHVHCVVAAANSWANDAPVGSHCADVSDEPDIAARNSDQSSASTTMNAMTAIAAARPQRRRARMRRCERTKGPSSTVPC